MVTKFVGTKQLRQNMAEIARNAQRKNERIIVLRKNQPMFELRPLLGESFLIESFRYDIEEARVDKKKGAFKSQAEVEKMLGL
ncbi:hypothetical protein KJ751_00015 [Patescibacteria group bacterium]|nr:hypothetical protein [Patescibacteria group bacterium]